MKHIELVNIYHDPFGADFEVYERILYDLLFQRKPYMNISHKEMPTYQEHQMFVKSIPYKEWYLIKCAREMVFAGAVYVSKQDEIGIFLFDQCRGQGYGRAALHAIFDRFCEIEYLYANIAPTNSGSIAFFVNMGFAFHSTLMEGDTIIQYTYVIRNPQYLFGDA